MEDDPATKEELSLVWHMCMSAKAVFSADICVWVACILKFGLGRSGSWDVLRLSKDSGGCVGWWLFGFCLELSN